MPVKVIERLNTSFSRRAFIKWASLSVAGAAGIFGFRELENTYDYDPANPAIEILNYNIGLPHKLYVVTLTDIHFGNKDSAVNQYTLELATNKIYHTLSSLGAVASNTMLTVTGDWVSKAEKPKFFKSLPNGGETDSKDIPVMLEIMRSLKADYKIGTLGNHDIKHSNRRALVKHLLSFGYQLPDIDANWILDSPIPILGLPDYTEFPDWYSKTQVEEIVNRKKDIKGTSLVLSHNASIVDIVGLGDELIDSLFSFGHTHGGHTNHEFLYPYALSENYHSQYVKGIHSRGSNIIHIPNGLGQHPQLIGRQVPAQVFIMVLGG